MYIYIYMQFLMASNWIPLHFLCAHPKSQMTSHYCEANHCPVCCYLHKCLVGPWRIQHTYTEDGLFQWKRHLVSSFWNKQYSSIIQSTNFSVREPLVTYKLFIKVLLIVCSCFAAKGMNSSVSSRRPLWLAFRSIFKVLLHHLIVSETPFSTQLNIFVYFHSDRDGLFSQALSIHSLLNNFCHFVCLLLGTTLRMPEQRKTYVLLCPFEGFIASRLQKHEDTELTERNGGGSVMQASHL